MRNKKIVQKIVSMTIEPIKYLFHSILALFNTTNIIWIQCDATQEYFGSRIDGSVANIRDGR